MIEPSPLVLRIDHLPELVGRLDRAEYLDQLARRLAHGWQLGETSNDFVEFLESLRAYFSAIASSRRGPQGAEKLPFRLRFLGLSAAGAAELPTSHLTQLDPDCH